MQNTKYFSKFPQLSLKIPGFHSFPANSKKSPEMGKILESGNPGTPFYLHRCNLTYGVCELGNVQSILAV